MVYFLPLPSGDSRFLIFDPLRFRMQIQVTVSSQTSDQMLSRSRTHKKSPHKEEPKRPTQSHSKGKPYKESPPFRGKPS